MIWDPEILTFIDEEPLKARLLLRGTTVLVYWSKTGHELMLYWKSTNDKAVMD